MKITAIITAGGSGKRMGSKTAKQYIEVKGRPIIVHTLDRFKEADFIDEVIIVVPPSDVQSFRESIIESYGFSPAWKVVAGGDERQNSVKNGLDAVSADSEIVVIHDGVRPFVTNDMIKRSVDAAVLYGAGVVAMPLKETVKKVGSDKSIRETVDRSSLWGAQTPQTFRTKLIKSAFEKAQHDGFIGTDDAMLVERLGMGVKVIEGDYHNIKITTPEDICVAEAILKIRSGV